MFFSNYHKGMTVKVMEKELKAAISKAKKKGDFKVEPVAETMTDIVEKLEAVNRSEYADYYFTTYLKKKSVDDALPLMVYLYALPLESLGAVLKTLQSENTEGYAKLARFDMELNNKQLFRKLLSKVQDFT